MSDESRSLPGQPSLRFLKLEARRRHAAGEFPTLHEAQLAIAREHGQSSWATLKALIADRQPDPEGAALEHVCWVTARFAGAGQPGWPAPGADELGEHFERSMLDRITPARLVSTLSSLVRSGWLRDEVTILDERSLFVRALAGDVRIQAAVAAEPPYRLRGMQAHRVGEAVTDARVATPPTELAGEVPAEAAAVAEAAFGQLGLPGLALAGSGDGAPWELARGWADLDRDEPLSTAHRFPVYAITTLVTATAVLRLVADGRVDLDGPVRDILTGNAGYAALRTLITDVTGQLYPDAVAGLVLGPLGMSSSWFPAAWPGADQRAVTGYELDQQGSFQTVPGSAAADPDAAGLWTTAADLVRFGRGWSSLLPAALAREALRPQARPNGDTMPAVGLGWRINESLGVAGHAGRSRGGSASLVMRLDSGQVYVAMTNRSIPVEPVNGQIIRAISE